MLMTEVAAWNKQLVKMFPNYFCCWAYWGEECNNSVEEAAEWGELIERARRPDTGVLTPQVIH